MYGFLYKLGLWLLQKLTVAGLIVVVGLAGYGLWLFLRDEVNLGREQAERVQSLQREMAMLEQQKARMGETLTAWQRDLAAEQQKIEQAGKILATLREMEGWWERWFGDPAQKAINEARTAV